MPHIDEGLPFEGAIAVSRHASYTGAKAAAKRRRVKTEQYMALLEAHGALSDQAVAALTGWGLSSVNSIRNAITELVEPEGFDTQQVGQKHTRRTRWRLRGHGARI